jgi:carbon monoxide dehydrogenase subunit G
VEFEGELLIAASAPTIWQALIDPQSLMNCVPEIESLTAVEPGREYEGKASLAFGGSQLNFPLRARWVELEPERYGRLSAVILAAGRQLELNVQTTLTANGRAETHLRWQAAVIRPDASPDEPPNILWQMVANFAHQRLDAFVKCLKNSLEHKNDEGSMTND